MKKLVTWAWFAVLVALFVVPMVGCDSGDTTGASGGNHQAVVSASSHEVRLEIKDGSVQAVGMLVGVDVIDSVDARCDSGTRSQRFAGAVTVIPNTPAHGECDWWVTVKKVNHYRLDVNASGMGGRMVNGKYVY